MAFGFQVTNNDRQLIVSSDTKNLHFIGKAQYQGIIFQEDEMSWNSGQWWYGAGWLPTYGWGVGTTIWRFAITCNSIPVPFYSQPGWQFMGIIGVTPVGGNVWYIDIAQDGGVAVAIPPEVYVFAEVSGYPGVLGESHGLQVLGADGSIAFDSRLKPLTVAGGALVAPPVPPAGNIETTERPQIGNWDGYTNETMIYQTMRASSELFIAREFSSTPVVVTPIKPIFNYYSIANAEREHYSYTSWSVTDEGKMTSSTESWQYRAWFWNFYRSGIQSTGDSIACGWISTDHGYRYTSDYAQSDNWMGMWTYDENSGSAAGGTWPFTNRTMNTQPMSVIIADGSLYD